MLRIWLPCLSIFLLTTALAQTGTLIGTIKDDQSKDLLIGVSVVVGTNGTVTDIDGKYSLELPAGQHTVSFSYIGYETLERTITLAAGQTLEEHISLKYAAENLDMVVVSAGRFEQRIEDITVSMEVVKPTMIENKGMTNIQEAIVQTPGVAIVDNEPQIRSGSGFSFGAGSRVMIMMDDLPLLSGDIGRPSWGFMPLENVEQMEVIKGASSVLYGSAALSGVINLRTAYPRAEPRTKVTVYSGIYDTPKNEAGKWWDGAPPGLVGANFFHSEQFGNVDLVLGGNVMHDTGHLGVESTDEEEYPMTNPWKDDGGAFEKRIRFNANFRYRNKKYDGLNYGINFNVMEGSSAMTLIWLDADSGLYRPMDGARTLTKQFQSTIDPFVNYTSKNGSKHSLRGRYFLLRNDNDNNQGNFSDTYYGEYQFQNKVSVLNIFDLNITAGVVGQYVDARSELYTGNEDGDGNNSASNMAAYIQFDQKLLKKINLSMGVRYENYRVNSDKQDRPVFRAGVNYELFKHTYLRGSYGQGFRFPTIGERYIVTAVGSQNIYPNPELVSESSWNAEFGVKQGIKIGNFKGFVDVVGFMQEYEDYIEFTFGQWGPDAGDIDNLLGLGFSSKNTGDARITGFEVTMNGQGKIGEVMVRTLMGYTYTNPISTTPDQIYAYPGDPNSVYPPATYNNTSSEIDGHPLKYRLAHLVRADLEGDWKRWMLGVSARYNSVMENIDKIFIDLDGTPALSTGIKKWREEHDTGDLVFDARMGYSISGASRISFIVNNFTNHEYAVRPLTINKQRTFMMQYTLSLGGARNNDLPEKKS